MAESRYARVSLPQQVRTSRMRDLLQADQRSTLDRPSVDGRILQFVAHPQLRPAHNGLKAGHSHIKAVRATTATSSPEGGQDSAPIPRSSQRRRGRSRDGGTLDLVFRNELGARFRRHKVSDCIAGPCSERCTVCGPDRAQQ